MAAWRSINSIGFVLPQDTLAMPLPSAVSTSVGPEPILGKALSYFLMTQS